MPFTDVSFSAEDIIARAESRLLKQFSSSIVLKSILAAMTTEIQALRDAATDVQSLRTPTKASGVNLEAIGRIVGQVRTVFDYGTLSWLTPDTAGYTPDTAMAWVTGSPVGTLELAGDGIYRNLIEAKVLRNFTQYGSIPEIQAAIETAYGIRVSFQFAADPMDINLVTAEAIPSHILTFLTESASNSSCDDIYYPPYPMTWRIVDTVSLNIISEDSMEFIIDEITSKIITI